MIRQFNPLMCSLVLVGTAALVRKDVIAAVPAVEAIEGDVLSSRRAITSGEVHLTTRVERHNVSEVRVTDYVIYFEGDKRRVDLKQRVSRPDNAHSRELSSSAAWGDDAFRFFTTSKTSDGGALISFIAPKDHQRAEGEEVSDVRMLGMYPTTFANLKRYSLNSRIGARVGVSRVDVEVENESSDGVVLQRIEYDEDWGRDIVWVSPSQDSNIVRIERTNNEGVVLRRLDVTLARVKAHGWFPSRVQYTDYDGSHVEKSETAEVRVVQFNQPVPRETWTFKGMGAPLGKTIYNFANGDRIPLDEDDVTLADKTPSQFNAAELVEAEHPIWKSTFLYVNGIVCLILAIALMIRTTRSRTVA